VADIAEIRRRTKLREQRKFEADVRRLRETRKKLNELAKVEYDLRWAVLSGRRDGEYRAGKLTIQISTEERETVDMKRLRYHASPELIEKCSTRNNVRYVRYVSEQKETENARKRGRGSAASGETGQDKSGASGPRVSAVRRRSRRIPVARPTRDRSVVRRAGSKNRHVRRHSAPARR